MAAPPNGRGNEGRGPRRGPPDRDCFLVTEALIEGAKWLKEKTRMAFGGEMLAEADNRGNFDLNAFRCNKCRRIPVRY